MPRSALTEPYPSPAAAAAPLLSLGAFVLPPTSDQWTKALGAGWRGPDGSSLSTDRIFGVRIGVTSQDFEFSALPANRHDWMYLLGRVFSLPEEYRAYADRTYLDLCVAELKAHIGGPMLFFAIARAKFRLIALRVGAHLAWTDRARARELAWYGDRINAAKIFGTETPTVPGPAVILGIPKPPAPGDGPSASALG